MSGVRVNQECGLLYQELKMKKLHRYIIFQLNDTLTEIVVHSTGDRDKTYQDFKDELAKAAKAKKCRYGVIDCPYGTTTCADKCKIIFFFWGPDNATVKEKMVYSASASSLRKELGQGLAHVIEAHDDDDLDWEEILKRLLAGDRSHDGRKF